jgi:hypothetical protein
MWTASASRSIAVDVNVISGARSASKNSREQVGGQVLVLNLDALGLRRM